MTRTSRIKNWARICFAGANQFGPYRSEQFALVSWEDMQARKKAQAVWPLSINQIIGGRRWSLNIMIFRDAPKVVAPGRFGRKAVQRKLEETEN